MSFLFGTSPIYDAIGNTKMQIMTNLRLDKATSECLPNAQEDLASTFEVCDMIKGKRVGAKDAMRALKKRLLHKNPNVQMLTLKVLHCFEYSFIGS
jgi:hypothetical protein